MRIKLIETPTIVLFQQENTSVNTSEPGHEKYIEEWNTYLQVFIFIFIICNIGK